MISRRIFPNISILTCMIINSLLASAFYVARIMNPMHLRFSKSAIDFRPAGQDVGHSYIESGLAAIEVPVLGEEVAVVEGSGQADQREQEEHGHEEEDELVHGALDARHLVGLELGVEHELGVAACVDSTAVDEGR